VQFLLRVCLIFLHIELLCDVHALDQPLRPHPLEIVRFQFGFGGEEPAEEVGANGLLCTAPEVSLLPELLLDLVDVALIFLDGQHLLPQQLEGHVCEEATEEEDGSGSRACCRILVRVDYALHARVL